MLRNTFINLLGKINPTTKNIYNRIFRYNEDRFATAMPVLIGLSSLLPVKKVLEFGSGFYSTSLFLNKSIFPDLIELTSYENDLSWYNNVKSKIGDDNRIKLIYINCEMNSVVSKIKLSEYDLIFIDDSIDSISRSETIKKVINQCDSQNIIVIHDYEIKRYRQASKGISHRFDFNAIFPNTGLVWDKKSIDKSILKKLNNLIYNNSRIIKATDIDLWKQKFKNEL